MPDTRLIIHEPDPANPGWMTWNVRDAHRFNAVALGQIIVRKADATNAVVRMVPTVTQSNLNNVVHGGATMTFIDVAMFATATILGFDDQAGSVTVSLDTQFIGAGAIDVPLDAEVEIIRATRRLLFLRGMVVQGDAVIASFSGILRRASRAVQG